MASVLDQNTASTATAVHYKPTTNEMIFPESLNAGPLLSPDATSAKRVLSFDEVCQTAGFVQNQPAAPAAAVRSPGNVRFIVQPVPADEIPRVPASLPSDTAFSLDGNGLSNEDLGGAYGNLSSLYSIIFVKSTP